MESWMMGIRKDQLEKEREMAARTSECFLSKIRIPLNWTGWRPSSAGWAAECCRFKTENNLLVQR